MGWLAMKHAQPETVERAGFKVICDACGSLSIKHMHQADATPASAIQCGRCKAVRGTVAELHDLARRGKDIFDF
jgi:hypothetical protein